jgi:hypothetical protein
MVHNFDEDDAHLQTRQYFTGDSDTMCLSSLKSVGPFGVIMVDMVMGSVKNLTIKSM